MRYIGVDPGVSGGLAAIDDRGKMFGAMRMPADDDGYLEAVDIFTENNTVQCIAVLEQVHSSPQMGVVSAFTFGGAYRGIRVALRAFKVPVVDVRPLRWQTALNCRTGGDKKITKALAQSLFPDVTVTLAFADALLLAEYGRRFHKGGGA